MRLRLASNSGLTWSCLDYRHRLEGTHEGPFQGIPPTGRRVSVSGIDIQRWSDGKLQDLWLNADFLGMLQQLGVIPQPETAGA